MSKINEYTPHEHCAICEVAIVVDLRAYPLPADITEPWYVICVKCMTALTNGEAPRWESTQDKKELEQKLLW